MSSVKVIRRRIRSSKNIAQITKAMEMVSASKMRRAQEAALSSRPYAEKMMAVITALSSRAKNQIEHFLLTDPRLNWDSDKPFNILIVLISTDKSLCGGLNTNLFRGLEAWLKDLKTSYQLPPQIKLNFITVGKKAKEHILKSGRMLLAEFSRLSDRPKFTDITPISRLVIEGFKKGEFQMAFLVFMKFISTISQKISSQQLLPIQAQEISGAVIKPKTYYLFEPSPADIFKVLLPQYIELRLYHTLIESIASEHSARMVAMKNANENALEIVSDLTLEYNQARQTKITNELLDVTGARMALE